MSLRAILTANKKHFLFLAVLVFLVYLNALGGDFLSDDIDAIKLHPLLNSFSYAVHPFFGLSPNALLYFLINALFGVNPAVFHLSNILFHLGSTYLIFLILTRFFKTPVPLLAASLFAVHPLLTEAVTWISGSAYVEMTFYSLLTLFLYILSANNRKYYWWSVFFCLVAFATSERTIILPAIITLYELLFGNARNNWQRLLLFWLLGIYDVINVFGAFRVRETALTTNFYQEKGIDNPLLIVPVAIASYLGLLFWPKDLAFYHSELSISLEQFWVMTATTLSFLGLTAYTFWRDKRLFFWLAFFLVALTPYLTPFRISWVVAERYIYLSAAGFLAVAAYFMVAVGRRFLSPRTLMLVFATIIIILGARTVLRNFDFANADALWLATAKTSPGSPQNHNNLGDYYGRRGDLARAEEEFKTAIILKPNYGDAYHNLGNTYRQMGKMELARENYQKALSSNPRLWQSHQQLAAIFYEQKDPARAIAHLEAALAIVPNNQDLRAILEALRRP